MLNQGYLNCGPLLGFWTTQPSLVDCTKNQEIEIIPMLRPTTIQFCTRKACKLIIQVLMWVIGLQQLILTFCLSQNFCLKILQDYNVILKAVNL